MKTRFVLLFAVVTWLFQATDVHAVVISEKFEKVKTSMKRSCSSTGLETAMQYIDQNAVTGAQVKELMACLCFDSHKLALAKYAYVHVIDKENYIESVEKELFLSSKHELEEYIKHVNALFKQIHGLSMHHKHIIP